MSKVKKLMQEYCLDRSHTDIISVYDGFYSTLIDVPNFVRLWDKLAIELNYPIPELMYLEDNLVELITINNYRPWFDLSGLDMFDDEYEILEQFNVEYRDLAIQKNIKLSIIKDILDFILEIRTIIHY